MIGSRGENSWFSEGGPLRGGKGGVSLPMRVEECPKSRNPRWDPLCDWKQRGEFVVLRGGSPRRVQAREGSFLMNGTFLVAGSVDVPFHQLSSRCCKVGFRSGTTFFWSVHILARPDRWRVCCSWCAASVRGHWRVATNVSFQKVQLKEVAQRRLDRRWVPGHQWITSCRRSLRRW